MSDTPQKVVVTTPSTTEKVVVPTTQTPTQQPTQTPPVVVQTPTTQTPVVVKDDNAKVVTTTQTPIVVQNPGTTQTPVVIKTGDSKVVTTTQAPVVVQTPTQTPTQTPSQIPTQVPTQTPTQIPTQVPTQTPTKDVIVDKTGGVITDKTGNVVQIPTPSQLPTIQAPDVSQAPVQQNPFAQIPTATEISDLKGVVVPTTGQCLPSNLFSTGLLGFDVGVGAQGDVYAVGVDGFLYYYKFILNQWHKVEADFELTSIARVDVSYDGTPYVVTACGDTYYLSCDNRWIRLPGCATDIGVGRGGEVFKLGCDNRGNGNGVYRLFCEATCECHTKCLRYKKNPKKCGQCSDWSAQSSCYWFRVEGAGTRIDVAPTGHPVVVDSNGDILINDGTNWTQVNTSVNAVDITASNENEIFFTGTDKNIYRLLDTNGSTAQICGSGTNISAGPFSEPFVIGTDNVVYTTAKQGYN